MWGGGTMQCMLILTSQMATPLILKLANLGLGPRKSKNPLNIAI